MADQADVRRIALSLPDTVEADDWFAFSVLNKGKHKGVRVGVVRAGRAEEAAGAAA